MSDTRDTEIAEVSPKTSRGCGAEIVRATGRPRPTRLVPAAAFALTLLLGGCVPFLDFFGLGRDTGSLGTVPSTAPSGLGVAGATSSSLNVFWSALSDATAYEVYRDTTAAGSFATRACDGSATSFTDSGLSSASTTTIGSEARTHWDPARTRASCRVPRLPVERLSTRFGSGAAEAAQTAHRASTERKARRKPHTSPAVDTTRSLGRAASISSAAAAMPSPTPATRDT